jgi:hypothetical protein
MGAAPWGCHGTRRRRATTTRSAEPSRVESCVETPGAGQDWPGEDWLGTGECATAMTRQRAFTVGPFAGGCHGRASSPYPADAVQLKEVLRYRPEAGPRHRIAARLGYPRPCGPNLRPGPVSPLEEAMAPHTWRAVVRLPQTTRSTPPHDESCGRRSQGLGRGSMRRRDPDPWQPETAMEPHTTGAARARGWPEGCEVTCCLATRVAHLIRRARERNAPASTFDGWYW